MTKSEGNSKHAVRKRSLGVFIASLLFAFTLWASAQSEDANRIDLAVEAITKVENIDLEQNPKLKETVYKLLEKTKGTPNAIKLIKHFKIKGHETELLDLAIAHPSDDMGIEAIRAVLSSADQEAIEQKLRGDDKKAATALVQVLGNAGSAEASRILLPILRDENPDVALRRETVRALAKTQEGAWTLLQLAKENQIAEALKFTAGVELSKVRWQRIKAEAATLLPLPQGQNNEPLPPLAELMKRSGNIENGKRVFTSATAACATCHKVKGEGTEVGPDLSEIGTKLAKEALYESILDPSAGISFGYEAWQMELKNGDEAYGLIVSETPEEIAIKNNTGLVTRYKKAEVKSRERMKLSIMPAGLQQAMSVNDLVDVIEYLASLKKPGS